MHRRSALIITTILLGMFVSGLFIIPAIIDLGTIPESDELWFTSGPYNIWENKTYSIYFRNVNFTFLYTDDVPLGENIPAHFLVAFADGLEERFAIYLPGIILFDDVVVSNHSLPQAAIYTHGAADVLGKWFCAVSLS